MAGWKKVIVSGSVAELHTLSISSASNAGLDTDKFLVISSSGLVHFRTGAQVLSDIGAGAGSGDISSVVAGSGLTGGATTGDATLNVIGGTGITANANDIALTNGLIADGSNITSVGTIGTGVWQGTTIKTAYIGDDQITEDKLANALLAEIDANTAKVTADATNVTSAGALMDSEVSALALIKVLTAASISGSFTSVSSSIAAHVATNTAKATNVSTNLSITGTDEARVIASSDGTNATIPVATTSVSGLMNTTLFDKLDGIEAGSDVTDATNVLAALPSGVVSASAQVSIAASQVTEISNLTAGEGAQLENIGSTTISATQWGYLGALDQAITTTSDVQFSSASLADLIVTGDLTVQGQRTELQVTNLNVEDQFILLNSGSTSGDSGIIFGGTGNGTAQAGHSIFCDDSDGNGATFGYKSQLAHNVTTGGTPTSKLGNIESSTSAPSSAPTFQGVGTIHVKTDDNEIYIYA
jgi:hypothetical protein